MLFTWLKLVEAGKSGEEQYDAMEGDHIIPDEVSDMNVDKCPHIVCFLDYERRSWSRNGRGRAGIDQ
jgi:hypothetical protein